MGLLNVIRLEVLGYHSCSCSSMFNSMIGYGSCIAVFLGTTSFADVTTIPALLLCVLAIAALLSALYMRFCF